MPVGRSLRLLTSYDLLGFFIPGSIVSLSIIVFLPIPPIPNTLGGYGLFAIFAFVIGALVQYHAAYATGDRRSFEWTMEDAEMLDDLIKDDSDDEGERNHNNRGEKHPCQRFLSGVIRLLTDPVIAGFRSPRGKKLDDKILVNRIWNHLVDTHEIPTDTEYFSVLYHIMSSTVDDIRSPSRAVRLQALRNFGRGMWIASWYSFFIFSIITVADLVFDKGQNLPLGYVYQRPAVFEFWTPVWNLVLVYLVAVACFWLLSEYFEEDYIEYLFADYAVAIASDETEVMLSGSINTDSDRWQRPPPASDKFSSLS